MVITSAGMWVSALMSSVISLYTDDLAFLFYALIFCVLGMIIERKENDPS
jgi:hypothetical protein